MKRCRAASGSDGGKKQGVCMPGPGAVSLDSGTVIVLFVTELQSASCSLVNLKFPPIVRHIGL
eukprot:405540-Hanusia_phi.AAC.1